MNPAPHSTHGGGGARHKWKGPLKARGAGRGAGKRSPEAALALAARVDALASAAAGAHELLKGLLADARALQHELARQNPDNPPL